MVFTITRFVPGGPIERMIAEYQMRSMDRGGGLGASSAGKIQPLSEEQINELKKYYGFDKPVLITFFNQMK